MTDLTAVDLFCGAGGLSAGLAMAGFKVLLGNDMFAAAGRTYQRTHPNATFLERPVEEVSAEDILDATGLRRGDLTVLTGGPPCQAYSVYNHQRGMHDARANLFKEYLRIVDGLRPRWVIMENVPGIYSIGNGEAVAAIKSGLARLGYQVQDRILKAEEYGVPQERRRVIFIGTRTGIPVSHPRPTHGPETGVPFVNVADAISDLPALANGEAMETVPYPTEAQSAFQEIMRSGSSHITGHAAPRLGAANMKRIPYVPAGGSWRDIPHELLPAGMQRAKRSDHTKRYGRMRWDGLASTILTKCDIHWGAFIHPEQDRAISVREAARLQSFPDWFRFDGSKTEQFVQIGNAVPPLIGLALGNHIADLDCATRETRAA